ncbi:MAG TPA: histidine kinase dimerization/phospho-acceptor domain-containing protein, partial [Ilumatobacteraceae bacterium]|nr:histidine kinase dimerization/phospho-acceptor domain-containing protein [Ilumatobacteraceae bacterium]
MTKRLLLSYLTITLVVLLLLEIPLGVFYAQRERERVAADLEHDANVIATLYEDDLEAGISLDPTPANIYEERTGARVVAVDAAGISQVDTGAAIERDFSTRPEIASALAGIGTSGTRSSDTLATDLLYVAVPVASGGTVHGALRITLDTSDVTQRIRSFWFALVVVAAVVLFAVAAIGWIIARSVTRPVRELTETASRFASGDLSVRPSVPTGPPEIRELDDSMTTMARRLDAVLTTQRAFVADASHQLRTPLTALRLRLENLQSRLPAGDDPNDDGLALDRPLDQEVERAIEETNRLTELVTNLLQLARADERPTAAASDLRRLVRDRADTWTAVADEHGVTLVGPNGGDDAPLMVRAVPGAIEQILDNVLDNAVRVSSVGAVVSVG